MLLVLDNHDSFTFNLVQALAVRGAELLVRQSDELSLGEIRTLSPSAILISPGPGRPCDAGVSLEVVRTLGPSSPILGVCLGHQVICEALGAQVVHAARPIHGRTSEVRHDGSSLFARLSNPFVAARYHSLCVDPTSLPSCLVPSAFSEEGELMAVRHRFWPMLGVQFHPESFLTREGPRMLENFLSFANDWHDARGPLARSSVHG